MLNRMLKTAALALPVLLSAGCGYGSVHGVYLAITDAPIDLASSVNISFSQIELSGPNVTPKFINLSPAESVDVYQLQSGVAATILAGLQLTPGHYTELTVTVSSDSNSLQSNITLPDGIHILYVPTGSSPKVNIPVDFDVVSGQSVYLTMDFDLRRSIVPDPSDSTKYLLIPSMRAVQNDLSGSITGSVATSLIKCLQPAVYVYPGDLRNADLTDVNTTAPAGSVQPITTALVGFNETSNTYNFTAAFLPAGEYTVGFTCEAPIDIANQSNKLTFTAFTHATVQNNTTTFVSLQ